MKKKTFFCAAILDNFQKWEVGAKRPLNRTSKVNTHTDRHTDGQTHRQTFRLIEIIGPEGRCFENYLISHFIILNNGILISNSSIFPQSEGYITQYTP